MIVDNYLVKHACDLFDNIFVILHCFVKGMDELCDEEKMLVQIEHVFSWYLQNNKDILFFLKLIKNSKPKLLLKLSY